MLQRNFTANQLNAEVVAKAATDRTGTITLHLGDNDLVSSVEAGHVAYYGGVTRTVEVEATTLDALVSQYGLAPSVVKVDVEGHELQVLRGAARTLAEHHPAVLIEAVVDTAAAVDALLVDHGYRCCRFDGNDIVSLDRALVPSGHPYANFLYEHDRSRPTADGHSDDRPQGA